MTARKPKSVDSTLPPWSPEDRLQAVRALATYCQAVETYGRTEAERESARSIKWRKIRDDATADLVKALAGVGLAVSFVQPVRSGPLQLEPTEE